MKKMIQTASEQTDSAIGHHTPGPWSTDQELGYESVLAGDGILVADCAIFVNPKFGKRTAAINRANARLIAAAPDMLAALNGIIGIARAATLHSGGDHNRKRIAAAQAAILKAEGRS